MALELSGNTIYPDVGLSRKFQAEKMLGAENRDKLATFTRPLNLQLLDVLIQIDEKIGNGREKNHGDRSFPFLHSPALCETLQFSGTWIVLQAGHAG